MYLHEVQHPPCVRICGQLSCGSHTGVLEHVIRITPEKPVDRGHERHLENAAFGDLRYTLTFEHYMRAAGCGNPAMLSVGVYIHPTKIIM